MEIQYIGHSCFKLVGKRGTAIIDPYQAYVGFALPNMSADVVIMSHDHPDHNAVGEIKGTARRDKPFIISRPGEYEIGGISVFGIESFHDNVQGAERGTNTIFTVLIDDVSICHLGDLGHELTSEQLEAIGAVDVVLCPVGGHFSLDASQAVKTILQLEPSYAIPMHYKTASHDEKVFGDVQPLEKFIHEYGTNPTPQPKLKVEKATLPEETELVVLVPSA